MSFSKFFSDLYTGPDGKTVALGRIYSVPLLVVGLYGAVRAIAHTEPVPLADLAIELGGVSAAVAAMIAATNHIDNPLQPKV